MKSIVSWSARWIDREKAKEATAELPGIGGLVAMGFRTESQAREWKPCYPGYEFDCVKQESHHVDDEAMIERVAKHLKKHSSWREFTLCPDDSPWFDFYRVIATRVGGVFDRDSANGDDYVVIRRGHS